MHLSMSSPTLLPPGMGASFPNLVSQMCDPGVRHLTKFVSQICDRGVRHDPILVSQNNDLVSVMVRHLTMEKIRVQ